MIQFQLFRDTIVNDLPILLEKNDGRTLLNSTRFYSTNRLWTLCKRNSQPNPGRIESDGYPDSASGSYGC